MIQAGKPVSPLTTFGGLASELTAIKLPAGPSPLCEDCDFDDVGSVRTRDGLFNAESYNIFSLKLAGTGSQVLGTQPNETPWSGVTNITLNDGVDYAVVVLNSPGGISSSTPYLDRSDDEFSTSSQPAFNGFSSVQPNEVVVTVIAAGETVQAASPVQTTYTLTAASNASGGNTTYTGTFSPVIAVGAAVNIQGFSNGGNNSSTGDFTAVGGLFQVVSCNATTLVVVNSGGIAETHAATAAIGFFKGFIGAVNNSVFIQAPGSVTSVIGNTSTLGSSQSWHIWAGLFHGSGSLPTFNSFGNHSMSGHTVALATNVSITAGHTILVTGTYGANAQSFDFNFNPPVITDNKGNVYTQLFFQSDANTTLFVAIAQNVVAAASNLTITATTASHTGGIFDSIQAWDVTGLVSTPTSGVSQVLKGTNFGFSIPSTQFVTGIEVDITGLQSSVPADAILTVNLLGMPTTPTALTTQLPLSAGTIKLGGALTKWNNILTPALFTPSIFGVSIQATATSSNITYQISGVQVKLFLTPNPPQNFDWVKTFEQTNGGVNTLALDASGVFYSEDVINNAGVLVSEFLNIFPNTFARSVTQSDREFIALSDRLKGTDMPRSWDGNTSGLAGTGLLRLSQEGPGSAPTASGTAQGTNIVKITQAAAITIRRIAWGSSANAINDNTTGSLLVIFGPGKTGGPPDSLATLPGVVVGGTVVLAGITNPFPGTAATEPGGGVGNIAGGPGTYNINGTYTVLEVGMAIVGGNESCPYFAVAAPAAAHAFSFDFGSGGGTPSSGWTAQMTLATMQTVDPIPNLFSGDNFTVSGNSQAGYNNTWRVVSDLNGYQMNITQTSLTGNVATYTFTPIGTGAIAWQATFVYALGVQIVDPNGYVQQVTTAGTSGASQPAFNTTIGGATTDGTVTWTNQKQSNIVVIVTGTTNGSAQGVSFNVSNAVIASTNNASGTLTFTVALTGPNVTAAAETGATGTIYASLFTFDPAAIVGTGTGGSLVISGGLAAGLRKLTVLFQTKDGYITQAAPPVLFSLSGSAQKISVSKIAIGPPNVVARIVAITNAGSAGVAGAYFYYIPQPVTTVSPINANQTITYSSTVIPNNTATTATFTITDAVLLNSIEIDVEGNDRFNVIPLGSCLGITAFSNRLVAWGVNNRITNLVNMSFDGGTLLGSATVPSGFPLGWTVDGSAAGAGGTLVTSPLFGFSYHVSNTTGGTQSKWGMIEQSAYQDVFSVPIFNATTLYNIRIVVRSTTSPAGGNIIVDLFDTKSGNQVQAATLALTSLTSTMQLFTLPFVVTKLQSVYAAGIPNTLLLRVWIQNLANNQSVDIDRIEVFDASQPQLTTNLLLSYANDFESFDQVTGLLGVATENQLPVQNCQTLFDQLIILKTRSINSTTDNGVTEPFGWKTREISNKAGCVGPFAADSGEGWLVTADQAGVFVWDGGQPMKISGEIQPTWDSINWKAGNTIWVRNDIVGKRLCIGVPLPIGPGISPQGVYTFPAFQWFPDFPVNTNPQSPNVVLMLSYRELNTAAALVSEGAVRQTFMGTLKAYQFGRKWSGWSIQSPYADYCDRPDFQRHLLYCNGVGNSKMYQQALPYTQFNDDGVGIPSNYMTYGIPNSDEAEAKNMSLHRLVATFVTSAVVGSGLMSLSTYPDFPNSPRVAVSTPQTLLNPPPYGDLEMPLNRSGSRFFLRFSNQGIADQWFKISRVVLTVAKEPMSPVRGGNF